MTMRIVICAEVWSENLGDRVIADCMQGLLRDVVPGSKVTLLDLSMRRPPQVSADHEASARRRYRRAFFRIAWRIRSARLLLTLASWFGRQAQVMTRHARQVFASADLVIIGGGQLLADNELAFPLRLACLTGVAASMRVPVVVLCCGVGQKWSRVGAYLMTQALARVALVYVRDEESKRRLEQLRAVRQAVEVAPDPAILSSSFFPAPALRDRQVVGLGVMAPQVVARHAAAKGRDAGLLLRFWSDLIRTLIQRGKMVEIFTNGAAEDAAFAAKVADAAGASLGVQISVRNPASAKEFVSLLATYSGLVAYRLHACIVGVSYGVPTVGLVWDDKVRAFFHEIGLPQNVVLPPQQTCSYVARQLEHAGEVPPGAIERARGNLLQAVRAAVSIVKIRDDQPNG
jgi:polysaccharide pyruvyl transferase WcaK-like protein